MCITCGCGSNGAVRIDGASLQEGLFKHVAKPSGQSLLLSHHHPHEHQHHHPHEHQHHHPHDHEHHHAHDHSHGHGHEHTHVHQHEAPTPQHPSDQHPSDATQGRMLRLERDVLYENNMLAQHNRGYFDAKDVFAINLVSSPGSGKTALLEKTLSDLKGAVDAAVVVGDQQTSRDADRIRATGTSAVQINTGKGCHLDAQMVMKAMRSLDLGEHQVLFIENIGNLVCPALFDLGETERVVIMSVTEGDDKPLKYPDMFHSSSVCVINKIDLLPYVPFDLEQAIENAKKVNPKLKFFPLSCTNGEGLESWYAWLKEKAHAPQVLEH